MGRQKLGDVTDINQKRLDDWLVFENKKVERSLTDLLKALEDLKKGEQEND